MSTSLQADTQSDHWFTTGSELLKERLNALSPEGNPRPLSVEQLEQFSEALKSELELADVASAAAAVLACACATQHAATELLDGISATFKDCPSELTQTCAYHVLHVEADRLAAGALLLEVLREVCSANPLGAVRQESRLAQVALVSQQLVRELVALAHELRSLSLTPPAPAAGGQTPGSSETAGQVTARVQNFDSAVREIAKFNFTARVDSTSTAAQVAKICQDLGIGVY